MDTIASREFQSSYQRLVEPVIVKAKSRTLGTWYPAGTEPDGVTAGQVSVILRQRDDANEEIARLKKELAAAHRAEDREYGTMPEPKPVPPPSTFTTKPASNVRAAVKPPPPAQVMVGTASFNSRPFTPVPKGK